MEQKLNITEILKNKALGTKLWSSLFGDVYFNSTSANLVTVSYHKALAKFWRNAKLYDYDEAEPTLFPSKEMRDWSKFSWKKGDVLISSDGSIEVIFDKWYDDTYTSFYCKHYLNSEDKNKIVYYEEFLCTTARYSLENTVQTYINTIEERLGGKLNMETLEIEKTQPEFKDGDIIKMTWNKYSAIAIFWKYSNFEKGFDSHVFFNIEKKFIEYNIHGHTLKDMILRLATEEEKKKLFDALAKRGKAWDAEKKQIMDLKQKIELKPFDKVVVRCSKADKWSIDFFSYKVSNGYICTGDAWFGYCLPYNEETAHLLGTTDDWEGSGQ